MIKRYKRAINTDDILRAVFAATRFEICHFRQIKTEQGILTSSTSSGRKRW